MPRTVPHDLPDGLSLRARALVSEQGTWTDLNLPVNLGTRWRAAGVPVDVVDRARRHLDRWGGLMLPRSLEYDGGPWRFEVDVPHEETEGRDSDPSAGSAPAGPDGSGTPQSPAEPSPPPG